MIKKTGIIFIYFFIAFIILAFFLFQGQKQSQDSTAYFNIKAFGNLSRGNSMISGPGDYTLAPYLKIPGSKFYVAIIRDDYWCINEDCGLDGAITQTMGGWLQMDTIKGNPDVEDEIGFDFSTDKNIKSLLLVGDQSGKIAGIYLNKNLKDVLAILKNHPDLANFDLLPGVSEFGKLKVGEVAPLEPGDSIESLSDVLAQNLITRIPIGKNFYLYAIQKRKYDVVGMYEKHENEYACILEAGCRYPEPDPPHDFLFAEIDDLDGWFLANDNDNSKMIELFGLDPQEVLNGKSSLVVLTDSKGIIVALHPNKTLSDAFTILSQHPDLADIRKLYPE